MRRRDYNNLRGMYQGPEYTRYPNGGVVPPRHHPLVWILVIILCLGIGWFAADHFLGTGSNGSSVQSERTVNKGATPAKKSAKPNQTTKPTIIKNHTTNNTTNITSSSSASVQSVQDEMDRLDVSSSDQEKAYNYFAKQSPKNQAKILKVIGWINKLVPSDTLKRRALAWLLS